MLRKIKPTTNTEKIDWPIYAILICFSMVFMVFILITIFVLFYFCLIVLKLHKSSRRSFRYCLTNICQYSIIIIPMKMIFHVNFLSDQQKILMLHNFIIIDLKRSEWVKSSFTCWLIIIRRNKSHFHLTSCFCDGYIYSPLENSQWMVFFNC